MEALNLRFVAYPEDGLWVAHSLDLDIIGVGDTPEEAEEELISNTEAHLSFSISKNISPFRPAPEKIQKMWDAGVKAMLEKAQSLIAGLEAAGSPEKPRAKSTVKKRGSLSNPRANVFSLSTDQLSRIPKFAECA